MGVVKQWGIKRVREEVLGLVVAIWLPLKQSIDWEILHLVLRELGHLVDLSLTVQVPLALPCECFRAAGLGGVYGAG